MVNIRIYVCVGDPLPARSFWAYIIASACGIIATLDVEAIEHHQTVDDLNTMCEDRDLPQDLRERLRTFFTQTRRAVRVARYKQLIRQMSPVLQGVLATEVCRSVGSSFLSRRRRGRRGVRLHVRLARREDL